MQDYITAPLITGMGVLTAIGQGKANFRHALLAGKTAFGYLQRSGRESTPPFLGAELAELESSTLLASHQRLLRSASFSTQVALLAALEAGHDAQLADPALDRSRIGLVIGGSNLQLRSQAQSYQHHQSSPQFVNPTYGVALWDTDLVGVLSQALQLHGEGYTVGGASASGALAMIQAARQLQSGAVDLCLVVGALFDLSNCECQGFRNLGAMGSTRFADAPQAACRPFDRDCDGFIYGEGAAAIVLERAEHAHQRGIQSYGCLLGWGSGLDGNRGANPNQQGEVRAMQGALQMAGLRPAQVDYINTHGTSSPLGDQTEVAAIKALDLAHAPLNATKALTGHTLTAAGVVEAVATLLQMQAGQLHPTPNLHQPIDPTLPWVGPKAVKAQVNYALSNSFGFGGINAALLFGR